MQTQAPRGRKIYDFLPQGPRWTRSFHVLTLSPHTTLKVMGFPHFTEEETGQQAAFLARPHIAGGLELGCKDVSPTASSQLTALPWPRVTWPLS